MLRGIVISLIFYFTAFNLFAQDFILKQYRAFDGLQTDMVKTINRDSLGFLWIGTDNGLVKYDGVSFQYFPEATASQYIKDIIRTKEGRLLIIHDLGVSEILSTLRHVEFKSLLNGTTVISDTALWYPKAAIEDSLGNIWIAEPQSIVKVKEDFSEWKRYHFSEKDNSVSFVRSFNFAQINKDSLLVSSFRGNYFIYVYSRDEIIPLGFNGPNHEIHVLKRVNNRFFAGTNIGLFEFKIINGVVSYSRPYLKELVTDIEVIDHESLIICSENSFNYYLKCEDNEFKLSPIEGSKLNTNQAFVWQENIWLSTQKGVALLKRPNFRQIKLDVPTMYVEALTTHSESPYVYLLGKEILWRINKETEESERIYESFGGYLLSGAATSKGIWFTDAFEIIYWEDGVIKDRVDLNDYGRFIFNISIDEHGLLWITQEASIGVKSYNPVTKELVIYDGSKGIDFEVTDVKATKSGVYISTNETKGYLLFKPIGSKFFKNISHFKPLQFSNLRVEDVVIHDSIIWMASNYGILKHFNDTLIIDNIPGNESGVAIRTLVKDRNYLWYGNQIGLYRYNIETGNYNLYNEQTGLSSNSINEEGILLDDDKLWVGTPFGVSLMDYDITEYFNTPDPFILSVLANGKEKNIEKSNINIPHGSYIEIKYSSLTYPSTDIQFSYRVPQINKNWSNLSFNGAVELSDLEMGNYTFEVRARKLGNYEWSDVTKMHFYVKPALYQSWIFYVALALVVSFFAFLTRYVTKRLMRKRQIALEKLVDERTAELEHHKNKLEEMVAERTADLNDLNEELKATNQELYNKNEVVSLQKDKLEETIQNLKDAQTKLVESEKMASLGILTAGISHEINNPLNFIMAGYLGLENFIMEEQDKDLERIKIHLESIRTGVDRATDIVQGLNQFARDNESYEEECNIASIIDNCILMIDKNYLDHIEIKKQYTKDRYKLLGNIGKMHQVFLNLMMNAAQAIQGKGSITITTELVKNSLEVKISDTGEGISKENLKKIMDPFFTTKDPGKGTGLGLSITARIINEHKGKIEYQSNPGEGTTAKVTFPISKD